MRKLIVSMLVLLAACSQPVQRPSQPESQPESPVATESACQQRGGQWRQLGRAPVRQCLLRTSDADKPCSDSDQCEGLCLAPQGSMDGKAAAGACAADTNRFGCRQRVDGGVATTLCVD